MIPSRGGMRDPRPTKFGAVYGTSVGGCAGGRTPIAAWTVLVAGVLLLMEVGCSGPASEPADVGPRSASAAASPAETAKVAAKVTPNATADVSKPKGDELFSEVAVNSGISFSYSNGRTAGEYSILESLGGGVAAFDYDLDGRVDLFFTGGGRLDNKEVTSCPCASIGISVIGSLWT